MINLFNMTFVLPHFMFDDKVFLEAGKTWTLDSSGKTDANKWPCCG